MAGFSVQARWALGLACAATALGAGLYVARWRRPSTLVAPSGSTSAAPPSSSAAAAASTHRPPPMPLPHWPFEDPSSTPKVLPFQSPEAEEEQRLRNLPPELRRAERSKRALERPEARVPRYPPDCRPAAEVIQRLLPHYVTPVVRPPGFGRRAPGARGCLDCERSRGDRLSVAFDAGCARRFHRNGARSGRERLARVLRRHPTGKVGPIHHRGPHLRLKAPRHGRSNNER